jgi:hypothetical protein
MGFSDSPAVYFISHLQQARAAISASMNGAKLMIVSYINREPSAEPVSVRTERRYLSALNSVLACKAATIQTMDWGKFS